MVCLPRFQRILQCFALKRSSRPLMSVKLPRSIGTEVMWMLCEKCSNYNNMVKRTGRFRDIPITFAKFSNFNLWKALL